MDFTRPPFPVAWCARPEHAAEIEGGSTPRLELIPARPEELLRLRVAAAIVDARLADTPEALASILALAPMPVLVRAPSAQTGELVPMLRLEDDVSTLEEPATLLEFRVCRLLEASHRDPLTRLFTSRALRMRLEQEIRTASPEEPVSVLILDPDRFKLVNDRHGHLAGDAVLQHLARLLLGQADAEVFAARSGGAAFTLILAGIDEPGAIAYAELLRTLIGGESTPAGTVTVSIGVTTTPHPVEMDELLREAEQALYAAKAAGRNRVVHFLAREREARRAGRDVRIDSFDDMQRVMHERQAGLLAMRSRRLFETLQRQADHDGLTGLFNRRYLDRRLELDFEEARRTARPVSVALIDVDFFGSINREHGWPTGDVALTGVARLIRRSVREDDWVARYGGEEITVVLPDTGIEEARRVLERVRTTIEGHTFSSTQGASFRVTVSVGIGEAAPGESLEALKDRLSDRLHDAKRGGRNQVRG